MGMTEAQSLAIESWTLYTIAILVVICRTYVNDTPLSNLYLLPQANRLTCIQFVSKDSARIVQEAADR